MVLRTGAIAVAVTAAGLALGAAPAIAQPVTNVNDNGPGSLRRAIARANLNPNPDVISFAIPGAGPHTIAPASDLPAITQPVRLDGSFPPGQVILDATAVNDGLRLTTSDSTIRGLVIQNAADDGIAVQGDRNVVAGNYVGTDALGQPGGFSNGGDGVQIDGDDNQVGGVKSEDPNVIADSLGAGLRVTGPGSTGNVVQGNLVGLDATGLVGAGIGDGVAILGDRNVIGGSVPEARNVIADTFMALTLDGDENHVEGNAIGTDVTTLTEVGNFDGVVINGNRNVVGGSATDGTQNVISGNEGWGVEVQTGTSNEIAGNLIGPGGTGAALLGFNNQDGVLISSSDNQVGGAGPGEGNVVSENDNLGIELAGDDNAVLGNKVGTSIAGDVALSNGNQGIYITGADNLVGGAGAGEGNVISGNGYSGIEIRGQSHSAPRPGPAT